MEKKLDTKSKLLIVFAIIVCFFTVFGATFSYIKIKKKLNSEADLQTLTNTTDSLLFYGGKDIEIEATYDNFGDVDRKNLSGETSVSLTLKSNNTTNTATTTYSLFLTILENDFIYTTADKQAELLMQIIDPNGNEVKTLPGYNYVTSEGTSGFDITEVRDSILFTDSYIITSGIQDAKQEWTVRVILINLSTDQEDNTGKHFNANVRIDKNIYLADHLKWRYDKTSNFYHHDSTLANGANDGSYRFAGASNSVKNYVCFGTDADPCPDDNLYRIIGLFGKNVKLIKDTSIGNYAWMGSTSSSNNNWSSSTLNKTTLNGTKKGNFLFDLGTEWSDKIVTTTWYVGGHSSPYEKPKNFYDYEVGVNKTNTIYNAKIGLMYVSDYGFATTPANWTYNLSSYDSSSVYNSNWLFSKVAEWTITRYSSGSHAYNIESAGDIDYNSASSSSYQYAVRPTFYLDYSVYYVKGTGTKTDPIRVA